jgi:predicted DNA-binding transcriptional regulator YafY
MAIILLNRLEYLDYLICSRCTGKPKELATKLGISERALYNMILLMKAMGAPIFYNRKNETYFYETEGRFNFRFKEKNLKSPITYESFLNEQLTNVY